jgi:hypothetical protein
MVDIIVWLNTACAAGMCLLAGWVIVHPRIHEGVVTKVGLIVLACGAFGVAALIPRLCDVPEVKPLLNAITLGNVGVTIAAGGVAWRIWHAPEARQAFRRMTGWPDLDDRPVDPLA